MSDIKTRAREIASTIVREASPAGLCDVCIDDITAALLSARLEALEEAAKAVEERFGDSRISMVKDLSEQMAFRIRSLKGE
jgi:hypothetical protein